MKRDMDLIRKILFKIEDEHGAGEGLKFNIGIEDYDKQVIAEHCSLLYEAGLVKEYRETRGGKQIAVYQVGNLSNRGYDYIEMIRSDKVWEDVNKEIKKKKLPETIETIGIIAGSIVGSFMREYNR